MEHPYLFFVKLFEAIGLGHFAHAYPHVIYSWVVMIILIALSALAAKSVTLIPSKAQNVFELLISGMEEFMIEIAGEESRWLFPLIATVFIYIFVSNMIGLVPGFMPPTASLNTTLSCALVVVIFTHVIGIKYHGAAYIKHFMGPVWWMIPIIFPIEVIGHVARILSLTFRLFGNMMGHELVLMILFGLAGAFFAPLPIMALGIFVALVQAFVFFLLSIMYFAGAMEHAH
ncbi:MAG: F0F1 ATP synthase subunit A [Desulfobacterales bacterium]|uniref:ATP synthase subunit a n=1 Tax=Candidatus Desulfatibia vada TaxID=2841696 RepID=A0A8J6P132_9BACT|nr:F0F1 ATP synthase subunit A [Candidatus Desulfatibia vada]MBL6972316.1 F0F1 ATP synthase subunit A [Desulfobacterales bacterium]